MAAMQSTSLVRDAPAGGAAASAMRRAAPGARLVSIPGMPELIGTFMGRDALALAMQHLGIDTSDTVLLPAYTCQEVLRSFQRKAHVVFYDVSPDLSIDPDALRRLVVEHRPAMLLTTDYFGFRQPHRAAIKRLCGEYGTALIEDCAHALLTAGAGDTGDLAIYSFRKIVPVHDGGGLRVNVSARAAAAPVFGPRLYSNALSLVAQAKSRLNVHTAMLSRARVASHTTDKLAPAAAADPRIMPLSLFAARRLSTIDYSAVAALRRRDYLFWLDQCRENAALEPLFGELPDDVCPVGFPVKVRERAALERRTREAGFTLSVHWRLEGDIGPECATSHTLAGQLLTLPVAPDIREHERDRLARLLKENWQRG